MLITKPKYPLLSDDELLNKYKITGDQSLITDLFLRYSNLISGVCLKYLKDPEAAKDAAFSIYEELIHKTKIYEINNFKSWLFSVTKNHCISELKKNKLTIIPLVEDREINWPDYSGLDTVLEKEHIFNKLENCIGSLSKDQNVVINLFYLQKNCYKEIAATTGLDWNKIRSLVQNGKRNLKICMEAA